MNTKRFLALALMLFSASLSVHAGLLIRSAAKAPAELIGGTARTTANVATLGAPQRYNSYTSRGRSQDWQREQLQEVETEPPMNLVQG